MRKVSLIYLLSAAFCILIPGSAFAGACDAAQIGAMADAAKSGQYHTATMIGIRMTKSLQGALHGRLSSQRASQALRGGPDLAATLQSLDAAKSACNRADTEEALFQLTAASYRIAGLAMNQTPQKIAADDAATAASGNVPFGWHIAAVSAYRAGDLDKALQYSAKELDTIRGFFAQPDMAVYDLQRAWNLNGIIMLARGDVASARAALANSVASLPAAPLQGRIPVMALAQQILQRGDRSAVSAFLGECARMSGDPRIGDWKKAVDAGQSPNFGPAALLL
ncbi:MAG: hypothetical protein ABJC09_01310 [Terriglobia bacterium]